MKTLLFTLLAIVKVAHSVPPVVTFPKSAATEGERCGGRGGPWCEDGLQCIGKAVQVDGQGTCVREATNCPPGIEVAKCFANPCSLKECPINSDATCVSNYCGGCNAVFYDWTGQTITNCKKGGSTFAAELKEEGEKCGACFGPPNVPCDYGACASGLECTHNPLLPDAAGKCKKVRQLGETCGSCFGPQCNHGPCATGLDCVYNKLLPDAPGKCRNPSTTTLVSEVKQEGEICGICFNPNNNNFCGNCASGLDCNPQHNPGLPDAPGKCEKRIEFSDEGERCGANAESGWSKKCKSGLRCDSQENSDGFHGTCVKQKARCTPGRNNVPSPYDSCNVCSCNDDGTIGSCTEIGCRPQQGPVMRECAPNTKILSPFDSCNTCQCTSDGTIGGCTKKLCRDHFTSHSSSSNYDKLLYCAKEGKEGTNECEENTDGEFTSCHHIITIEKCNGIFCHGVCVPGDKGCKSDDDCKPIGNGDAGLLRAECTDNKCEYDRAIILH